MPLAKRMRRIAAAAAIGMLGAALASHAAARPDFSGRWTLDLTRSEFGKIPGGKPIDRTDLIQHRGTRILQTLYIHNAAHRDTTIYTYSADSTLNVNLLSGQRIESFVWWEGNTLRFVSRTKMLMFEMALRERWSLSPDGRMLTVARHLKYPLGEGDQTLVFARQQP